ncbi:MAG: HAMP domain-containing sensor histidine kinase [Bacillota bacterium]|nr:HAMP domain-containing sensor histidine kinase [Bacillota bacterium]
MRKKGLVYKTVLIYTLIFAVCITVLSTVLSLWFQNFYYNSRKEQLDKQARVLSDRALMYFNYEKASDKDKQNNNYTYERLKEDLELAGSYVNAEVLVISSVGYVHANSDSQYDNLLGIMLPPEDMEQLRLGMSIEKKSVYTDKNGLGKEMYVYIVPVIENEEFRCAVDILTPTSYLKIPLKKTETFIWMAALLLTIGAALIIYRITKRMIIKPLAEINSAARKISKGEVQRRVDLKSRDEIGELAESFNIMADSLEKVEKNRREFISNVSHELRSPITSIKGFIGGILDGVIPKDKESYYLSVTYEEIQRLTRLVNDLLDLSAMEAGKFKLNIAEIDINEIIRLCVIKFETRINAKRLQVDVTLQDEHLYAVGDRDRIVQVVTNLLDNAIKYVNEGGNIKIVTRTKADKVLVTLYNNGPVIPEEDLKHIWERFYKSDKSRTSKVSTGLGLPIVRNILTQLGEDIWVENGEKEGVTFYFTLKKA